jgi:hypothetical protein
MLATLRIDSPVLLRWTVLLTAGVNNVFAPKSRVGALLTRVVPVISATAGPTLKFTVASLTERVGKDCELPGFT